MTGYITVNVPKCCGTCTMLFVSEGIYLCAASQEVVSNLDKIAPFCKIQVDKPIVKKDQ